MNCFAAISLFATVSLSAADLPAPSFFIDPISAAEISEETTARIEFDIHSRGIELSKLSLSANSSDANVIPDTAISWMGIGQRRAIILAPRKPGAVSITVSLFDGRSYFRRTFAVTVTERIAWSSSMLLSAVVAELPVPTIRLVFPIDRQASNYEVHRKELESGTWGDIIVSLPGTARDFTDTNVVRGRRYEYKVVKNRSFPAFLYAGVRAKMIEDRGTIVLVVDKTYAPELREELSRLEHDIMGDGWSIIRHDVGRDDAPSQVKKLIKSDYDRDPTRVRSVFLFGHVPIAYSGWYSPDGHHQRAFPADAFYGDMHGTWTDEVPGDFQTLRPETRNYPGDGVFDQSRIPARVDLQVGRVDLFNMPAFLPRTEKELLRQYLDKDHRYRKAVFKVEARGLADGWTAGSLPNQAAMFGPSRVSVRPFFSTLKAETYLWASRAQYGNYQGFNDGGGSTSDFASLNPRAVFLEMAGSYFGEWDIWNNFLRAPLCTSGYGLAASYSMPHWHYQHLALGETLGFSARIAQNNQDQSGLYSLGDGNEGMVHIALMGDPTLRLNVVCPVRDLIPTTQRNRVRLEWNEPDEVIEGYLVYRSPSPRGPFTRRTAAPIKESFFVDSNVSSGDYTYMVRVVKLQITASGTYENLSEGVTRNVLVSSSSDTVPPIVRMTSPAAGIITNNTVKISAFAEDDRGIAKVNFLIDGQAAGTLFEAPFVMEWNSRGAVIGNHTFTARAFDYEGNSAEDSVFVRLANQPMVQPTVSLVTPVAGERVWGNVVVRAACSDTGLIKRVDLRIDNGLFQSLTAPPYETVWKTFDFTTGKQTAVDGVHGISATAYDSSGARLVSTVPVTVDSALSVPTILEAFPARVISQPGLVAELTYRWRGGPASRDWRVFTHLVDESGNNFGLDDFNPPVPTHYWSGDNVCAVKFRVPRDLRAGLYKIMSGLYMGPSRALLNPGPGVLADDGQRYQIGTLSLLRDTTPPRIVSCSLKGNEKLAGKVNIAISGTDNLAVDHFEVLVNGKKYASPAGVPNVSEKESARYDTISYHSNLSWDTSSETNGSHRITVRAVDTAGNPGDAYFDVTVSNPVVLLATPAISSVQPGGKISITYHWSGGPTRSAARVTTDFISKTTRRSAFRVIHTPDPPPQDWTGRDLSETRTIPVPTNIEPGEYHIAVRMSDVTGVIAFPLVPGPGVVATGKDLTGRYYVATLKVLPQ